MDLNILIFGDIDFAADVMHGIARLFMGPNEDSFHQATATVMVVMMFISSLKYFMDPEKSPYPFKEFVYSIIAWVIFVGPLSPRFDVNLESYHDPLSVRSIDNIPFLAAVPAWATSNLLGGVRDLMKDAFSPVGFSSGDAPDPLGALVTLHKAVMPNGAANSTGVDFSKTYASYMRHCYIAENKLMGEDSAATISDFKSSSIAKIIDNIAVLDDSNLVAQNYLDASTYGDQVECPTLYTRIRQHYESTIKPNMVDYYAQLGVSEGSLYTMQRLLTGGAGTLDTPYDLMANRLLLQMSATAFKENGIKEPWIDKMIAEATASRAYGAAAERSMFLEYMVPLVSMFEMFAFYIAPIMMLLAVMGGLGWSMLGKYMYLLLFVNLWGFIKVFVDLYTYLAAEKAFEFSAFNSSSYLSPADISNSVTEVESLLGVASSMTAAIPLLAMFLLYGEVHSMMGVMRQMNASGAGNIDANNMAPTVGSNWNNGTQNLADMSSIRHTGTGGYLVDRSTANNNVVGTGNVNDAFSNVRQNQQQLTNAAVQQRQTDYTRAFNTTDSTSDRGTVTSSGGDKQSFSEQDAWTQVRTFGDELAKSTGIDTGLARTIAAETMFSHGYDIEGRAGFSREASVGTNGVLPGVDVNAKVYAGMSFGTKAAWTDSEKDTILGKANISESDVDKVFAQLTNQSSTGEGWQQSLDWSSTEQIIKDESFMTAYQSTSSDREGYVESLTAQQSVSTADSFNTGVNNSVSLEKERMRSLVDGDVFDQVTQHLNNNKNGAEYTSAARLLGVDEGANINASDILDKYGAYTNADGGAFKTMDNFLSDALAVNGEGYEDQKDDVALGAFLAGSLVSNVESQHPNENVTHDTEGYRVLSNSLGGYYSKLDTDSLSNEKPKEQIKDFDKNNQKILDDVNDGEKAQRANETTADPSQYKTGVADAKAENVDATRASIGDKSDDMRAVSLLTEADHKALEQVRNNELPISHAKLARQDVNQDNFGELLQSVGALNGNSSDLIDGGANGLFQNSQASIGQAINNVANTGGTQAEARQVASYIAAVDALRSTEGLELLSSMDEESRGKVIDNAMHFDSLMSNFSDNENIKNIAGITGLQMSGAITDDAASTALGHLGHSFGYGDAINKGDGSFKYQMENTELGDFLPKGSNPRQFSYMADYDFDKANMSSATKAYLNDAASLVDSAGKIETNGGFSYTGTGRQDDGSGMSVTNIRDVIGDIHSGLLDGDVDSALAGVAPQLNGRVGGLIQDDDAREGIAAIAMNADAFRHAIANTPGITDELAGKWNSAIDRIESYGLSPEANLVSFQSPSADFGAGIGSVDAMYAKDIQNGAPPSEMMIDGGNNNYVTTMTGASGAEHYVYQGAGGNVSLVDGYGGVENTGVDLSGFIASNPNISEAPMDVQSELMNGVVPSAFEDANGGTMTHLTSLGEEGNYYAHVYGNDTGDMYRVTNSGVMTSYYGDIEK
ncbi:hypothetical protein C9975_04595 [Thalassospira xiamenensis]|nr:hypothetical protein C9975_04595 [Thalassospira xiamenensis]